MMPRIRTLADAQEERRRRAADAERRRQNAIVATNRLAWKSLGDFLNLKERAMPDVTIPVGSYSIWTIVVTGPNGQTDTTSPITVNASQAGFVLLDPVVLAAGNRQFYVTGVAQTSNVTLIATDQAGRHAFAQVQVSQPDLSGISSAGFGPVLQGAHP